MEKFIRFVSFCIVLSISYLLASEVNPTDTILTAYPLSLEEEDAFSLTDGSASSFWDDWHDLDLIKMDGHTNEAETRPPFDGAADAHMIIRAAYGLKGLYLHIFIMDDKLLSPKNFSQLTCDAIDLYFDSRTQEEIKNVPRADMATPWYNAITKTTKQLNVWVATDKVNYQYWDDALMQWVGIASLGGMNVMSFEEIQDNYDGLGMERIGKSNVVDVQEWFLPWSQLGIDITAIGTDGMYFGFSGGYNDKDDYGAELGSGLWWLKHNPWSYGPPEDPDNPRGSVKKVGACQCPEWALESWGHIYLPFAPPGGSTSNRGIASTANCNALLSNVVKIDYFSLQGKRISQHTIQNLRPNTVIIKRVISSNGKTQVKKIQLKNQRIKYSHL